MTEYELINLHAKLNHIWQGMCSIVNRLDAQSEAMNITVHDSYWNEYTKSFEKFNNQEPIFVEGKNDEG